MKKIFILVLCTLLFIPTVVFAATQALDLKDTVLADNLTPSFDDTTYKETDDQVTVYLFRSPTCVHCNAAIEYFNEIVGEYGEKFKLRSYDVVNNKDNKNLKNRVTEFLDIDAPNVPLIIIGDQAIYGFGESSKETIKTAINAAYESETKYDVIEEMAKGKKESKKPAYIIAFILSIGVIALVIFFIKKK